MTNSNKPVFYTESKTRLRAFISGVRFIIILIVLSIFAIGFAFWAQTGIILPKIADKNETMKRILNPEHIATFKTKLNENYMQIRKKVEDKAQFDYLKHKTKKIIDYKHLNIIPKIPSNNIRAGFYVNWDLQSFYSLKNNIHQLDIVFPEWLFISDSTNTVFADIDFRALELMHKSDIAIIPMISNYFKEKWNSENVHRIITSKKNTNEFISSLLQMLIKYDFDGVNIDFESLKEASDEHLINFQKTLYDSLHLKGYIVSQDIATFNTDYNLEELSKYNDYFVLMAYDQHYASSDPGAIAPAKWVDAALENTLEKIPAGKVILGLATYGYDWKQGYEGTDITYQEAIVTAKESDGKIVFDNDNYNLTYKYIDEDNIQHEVWFTDAATTFNLMRSASDYNIAGVALWRLGGEDSRIWDFFSKDLSDDSLKIYPYNFNQLTKTTPSQYPDFIGEGEIMDIVSITDSGDIEIKYNDENVISEQIYTNFPTSYVIKKYGKLDKKVILTFDDGPSSEYTPRILDILEKEKVPAAFFVIGINAENNLNVLKRMYDDGFEIGNHSFSHPNMAQISSERSKMELNATRRIIECITGHSTILFRPPYNADSEPETLEEIIPIEIAKESNYYTVGESIDPLDWQKGISPDSIFNRIIREEKNGNIILLHDAGGNREATIIALPRIIHYFKNKGYQFISVAELIGKPRDYVMPQLSNKKDIYLSDVNLVIAEFIFWIERILVLIFFVAIFLSVFRSLFIGILAAIQKKKERIVPAWKNESLVSVIIPAYNEELNSSKTISTILNGSYKNLEIIFVDDGSKDSTYQINYAKFKDNPKVKLFTKENGGKASALNFGISKSQGDYIVCIDGDTQLAYNAIENLMSYFFDDKVGAVAGNVKVGNKTNILSRWQSIEYITSQNFDRRAFDVLNAITVIPGAIGAFRKSAVIEAGLFTIDTLAEDCDLTIRILKNGYKIKNCISALAFTEAPETLKMFVRQRYRWSFGIMQSIWKNRNLLFRTKNANLGFIALPNILLFQFILPVISPIIDILTLLSLFGNFWKQTLMYYLLFSVVDFIVSIFAFRLEKESLRDIWLLIPQRIIYRQFIYYVLIKSIVSAITGGLVKWGTLKRTGTVKVNEG
jgi:cellulose synthase/poly-beta-1,6-N-acetylglucosamine synthase-like glycosyltransferase/spore germination protein YaaH/peptidoglycan/xylan/chitin deacetylase (PgdA/CDA1 family)